jgi:hypothetical protein
MWSWTPKKPDCDGTHKIYASGAIAEDELWSAPLSGRVQEITRPPSPWTSGVHHQTPALNLSQLHMPPPATVSGGDLAGVQLPGDGVEARMTGRLDLPDNRQNVGRELRRLRLAGHPHALNGSGGVSGVPSRFPRALAAARAALVRSEIASRSCSATAARMWIVSLLACGLSTAMNSTPESIRVATKARFRESRSSLAMTSRASVNGARQFGAIRFLAALNLDKFADQLPSAAIEKIHNGLLLGLQAEPASALAVAGRG